MTEKLVRDNIPRMIMMREGKCDVRIVSSRDELEKFFIEKFREELQEFFDAKENHEKARELADLLEVIRGWCETTNAATFEQLHAMCNEKRRQNGGFGAGLVLRLSDEKTA